MVKLKEINLFCDSKKVPFEKVSRTNFRIYIKRGTHWRIMIKTR